MVLDYRERRQVISSDRRRATRNRPKNRPVNLIVLVFAGIVLGIYSLGVVTGWFLYKKLTRNQPGQTSPVGSDAKRKPANAALPTDQQQKQPATAGKSGEPALTFYYTLPKGEKTALGSGLNPAINSPQAAPATPSRETAKAKSDAPQDAAGQKNAPSSGRPPENKNSATAASVKKSEPVSQKFTVQVASCATRKEAEAIKGSLDRAGLLSHIVESRVPGKGTWYRVRLGSGLDRETAQKIAARAGRGSMVVPE